MPEYICDRCDTRYELEGRRAFPYRTIIPLKWDFRDGQLFMSLGQDEMVCENCWDGKYLDSVDLRDYSPWAAHYLENTDIESIEEEGGFLESPFDAELSLEEIVQEALKLDKQNRKETLQNQLENLLQNLEEIINNPDCDIEELIAQIRKKIPSL